MHRRQMAEGLASVLAVTCLSLGAAGGAAATGTTHKTAVNHAQSANAVTKGKAVTFSVTLHDATTKKPVAQAIAKLEYRHGSTWITREAVRTGSTGRSSAKFKPASSHSWRWVAPAFTRSGIKYALAVSSVFKVAVKAASHSMNLGEIAQGRYRSLLGRWSEAAVGANCFCGNGVQWHRGGPDTLSVAATKIVNGSIVVQGKTLSDGQGLKDAKLVFVKHGKYLVAGLADQSVAINYAVSFYPRGVPADLTFNNGVRVPSSTNRIEVWSSNDTYTEVFVQK